MASLPHVLYVDDEVPNLNAFRAAFRQAFHVHVASSPQEALQVLDTKPIDVMITDQRMPSMTGIDLVRGTKASHPEVVKIILTGFADHDVVMDAMNEGWSSVFEKPWNQAIIVEDVNKAFDMLVAYRRRKGQLLEMRANLREWKASTSCWLI